MLARRITAFGWYTFEVYNIDGWSTDDGGSRLKSEEKGCGALTGWDWRERTSSKYAGAYFNLPFFMKDGCVERAIVSAGGPKLSCDFTGYDIGVAFLPAKKRSTSEEIMEDLPELRQRQYVSDTPSLPGRSTTQSTTYSQEPTYSPEPWGPGDTVTFTTTIESVTKSTYTTEIVLASMGATGSSLSSSSSSSSLVSVTSTSSPTSSSSSVAPSATSNPSIDGRCGADFGGTTCVGSGYGGCCSEYGYCGDTTAHCSTGCQSEFGSCTESAPVVSTDGTCSSNSDPEGATCLGSVFGDCCSEWAYCGSTNAYCGTGCQLAFGSCTE